MTHFTILKEHALEIFLTCSFCMWGKLIVAVATTLLAFLVGVHNFPVLVGLALLMVFDTITAIVAAKMNGLPVTSRRFLKGASKVMAYFILCSAAFATDEIVPGPEFITITMATYLALTELISIMENIGRMGYSVPLKLLNQLQELRNNK